MYPSVHSGINMHWEVLVFFEKYGPEFKIGQTDLDDFKKHNYRCAQVITKAKTCI